MAERKKVYVETTVVGDAMALPTREDVRVRAFVHRKCYRSAMT